jgi:type I restriction enzyme M protein
MQADGYSLDDKRDKITETDIPDILAKWSKRNSSDCKDRGAKAFTVSVEEIREKGFDLSIGKYKEERRIAVKYDPPEEIIENLLGIEQDIVKDLHELKGLLK